MAAVYGPTRCAKIVANVWRDTLEGPARKLGVIQPWEELKT